MICVAAQPAKRMGRRIQAIPSQMGLLPLGLYLRIRLQNSGSIPPYLGRDTRTKALSKPYHAFSDQSMSKKGITGLGSKRGF